MSNQRENREMRLPSDVKRSCIKGQQKESKKTTGWEKIFPKSVPDKGHFSRPIKKTLEVNSQKSNNPIKK